MSFSEIIITVVVAMGIPSAITGFCFWCIQRKIDKRDAADQARREARQKELDKREEIRYKNELYLIKSVGASIALGEATARAVQRIPDAHCNGDMHDALNYAQKVKHEQKDFLTEQAIRAISDDE